MTPEGRDRPTDPDDLRIAGEETIPLARHREQMARLSAARKLALITLGAAGAAALVILMAYALWLQRDPPAWSYATLSSIVTAAVAFLFGGSQGDRDRRG